MTTSTVTRKAKAPQHYHLSNGDRIPGVTTILAVINKPALVPWANGLGFSERVLSVPEVEPYFSVFLAALNLYNAMRLAKRERGAR